MKTINDFLYFLSKIYLDNFLECNDEEKFYYLIRLLIDDFEDFDSVRIENILIVLDGFINFFNDFNNRMFGYW